MLNKLYVSSSPHIKSNNTTQKIMLNVIIALIPAIIASVIIFSFRSLLVIFTTVAACVISEYICRKVMKRDNTVPDLSAVVTGILLAFNLPVDIKLWMAALGGIVAIVVVKQMFGGIGNNFVNPALVARIVLMSSFPTAMTTWSKPFFYLSADSVTTATPLALIRTGGELPSYFDLFMGFNAGCLGETCALALIIGGIYLVIQGVLKPVLTIPIVYIGTVAVLMLILGVDPLFEVLSGGLLLGAIFMATDYVTTPMTVKGQVIFALGCGIITALIRAFGTLPEGVSFSIIIMNILTPLIDRFTKPKPFGSKVLSK